MATNHRDTSYTQKYGNFNLFDNNFIDPKFSDNGKSEEQILSQNFTQLSTRTTNENNSLLKDIQVEIEKIPDYLTKRNKSFQQMIHQALSIMAATSTPNNNMEELRKIAILIYKIMIIQTYQLLWTAYLKSGMGQLILRSQKQLVVYPINLPIWPKEIKRIIQSIKTDKTANEHEICLNFVNDHLHELDHQLKQYQTELNIKANHFQDYTLTIQKMIETYMEQNLHPLRMEIEHQIDLVQYDYHIRALKIEYLRHNPNEYQVQLMKELCQSKYEQETTEQEYHFLQEQINYYNSPSQSFECCSSMSHSPLLDSIQNPNIRQQLFKQYKQVAEQTRANIFTLYMTTAEEQKDDYKKKYDANKQKMWNAYHSSIDNEKIDSIMLGLIHQRCRKISERIQCIYKLKIQSIISNHSKL